jgi:hypothetical protein
MNLKTPYDDLCSTYMENWASRKEDSKDYTFDSFCSLFIRAQEKLLDERNLRDMLQVFFMKEKGRQNYKERGHVGNLKRSHFGDHGLNHDAPVEKWNQHTNNEKLTKKGKNSNIVCHCGKKGSIENTCWMKTSDQGEG